jgi:AcrR family transcriptional regulator
MSADEQNTERLILEAAKKVFLDKGLDGARMQEIADEAGINKALLHYYFRSKDKLFEAIFEEAFEKILPRVSEVIRSDASLFEKLWAFIDHYIDILSANPHLPLFIFYELKRNPGRLIRSFNQSGIEPDLMVSAILNEIKEGRIRPVDPYHLMVNLLSMCIFPFVARPMIIGVMMKGDSDGYQRFLAERKTEIMTFIINSIKIEKNV